MYQVSSESPNLYISFSVRVEPDLRYTVSFCGTVVDLQRCTVLSNIPSCITSGKIKSVGNNLLNGACGAKYVVLFNSGHL